MDMLDIEKIAIYDKKCAGHGDRRCETQRKTNTKMHGHHKERHQEEWDDGRHHS